MPNYIKSDLSVLLNEHLAKQLFIIGQIPGIISLKLPNGELKIFVFLTITYPTIDDPCVAFEGYDITNFIDFRVDYDFTKKVESFLNFKPYKYIFKDIEFFVESV